MTSPALTIGELRAILEQCPDQDAVVYVDMGVVTGMRVLLDRWLVPIEPLPEYGRCLVIGSRMESDEDKREVA